MEGYELTADIQEGQSRTNHLRYTGAGVWQHRHAISFGVGLLIGIVLMLLLGTCSGSKDKEALAPAANPEDTATVVSVQAPTPAAPTVITEDNTQEQALQQPAAEQAPKPQNVSTDKPATKSRYPLPANISMTIRCGHVPIWRSSLRCEACTKI